MPYKKSLACRSVHGVGIGLRAQHLSTILSANHSLPWLEILADNYLNEGGIPLARLEKIRQDVPFTLHCIGFSLGSSAPLDRAYLQRIKRLADRLEPAWISDHLCWTANHRHHFHDLLPLPHIKNTHTHIADKIKQVQDTLGQQILIENISSYLSYKDNDMHEWEFLNAVSAASDCFILLDLNNIIVNAYNHGFSGEEYLQHVNAARVKQFHLAGFTDKGNYYFDTHSEPVHPPVWRLYEQALHHFGDVPTLIEWDAQLPPFAVLMQEVDKANKLRQAIIQRTNRTHTMTYN